MLFFINYKNQEHRVRVESRRNRLYVKFENEEEERIDLSFDGNDCTFIHGGRVFHANIFGTRNDYTVWRPQGNLAMTVESEYKRIVTHLKGQSLDADNIIRAKMPGKIVKVLTTVGSQVEQGQSVVIMEAMKMENEIRSTVAGKVTKIYVREGQAVESGAMLIEFETEEN